MRRSAPLTETNVLSLLTFLTLRLLFTGAGRVGTTLAAEWRGEVSRPGMDGVFQMSQRADYINNDLYEWVQFNRSIINTRDEPLGDPRKYRRLHLLHGDTSVLPATLLLKVGTTSLMLDLLEINHLPKVVLADAVKTFRALSHQPEGPWETRLADGRTADAVELLERFFSGGVGGISRARHGDGRVAGRVGLDVEGAGDRAAGVDRQGGLDHQALAAAEIFGAGKARMGRSVAQGAGPGVSSHRPGAQPGPGDEPAAARLGPARARPSKPR